MGGMVKRWKFGNLLQQKLLNRLHMVKLDCPRVIHRVVHCKANNYNFFAIVVVFSLDIKRFRETRTRRKNLRN